MTYSKERTFVEIARQDASEIETHQKKYWQWWILGLYLACLFTLNAYTAIAALGAHHIQHEFRSLNLDSGQTISIPRLKNYKVSASKIQDDYKEEINNIDRVQLNEAMAVKSKKIDAIENLENTLTDLNALSTSTRDSDLLVKIKRDLKNTVDRLKNEKARLKTIENKIYDIKCKLSIKRINAENTRHTSLYNLYEKTGFGTKNDADQKIDPSYFLGEFSSFYVETSKPSIVDGVKNPTLANSNTSPENVKTCPHPEILGSYQTLKLDNNIQDAMSSYGYFDDELSVDKNIFSQFLHEKIFTRLINTPQQVLTVILVMTMGGLGATISITRNYLDLHSRLNYANYVFLPFLGAITGFAVFILAKSGVLLIAESGGDGDGAYLSPYFVAFLGIISGLLSQEALDSILNVGRRMFKDASDSVERYFLGDKSNAENEDILKRIANTTKVPDDTVKSWLEGSTPVPPIGQRVIALQLDTEVREIFTDIAPGLFGTNTPEID